MSPRARSNGSQPGRARRKDRTVPLGFFVLDGTRVRFHADPRMVFEMQVPLVREHQAVDERFGEPIDEVRRRLRLAESAARRKLQGRNLVKPLDDAERALNQFLDMTRPTHDGFPPVPGFEDINPYQEAAKPRGHSTLYYLTEMRNRVAKGKAPDRDSALRTLDDVIARASEQPPAPEEPDPADVAADARWHRTRGLIWKGKYEALECGANAWREAKRTFTEAPAKATRQGFLDATERLKGRLAEMLPSLMPRTGIRGGRRLRPDEQLAIMAGLEAKLSANTITDALSLPRMSRDTLRKRAYRERSRRN